MATLILSYFCITDGPSLVQAPWTLAQPSTLSKGCTFCVLCPLQGQIIDTVLLLSALMKIAEEAGVPTAWYDVGTYLPMPC